MNFSNKDDDDIEDDIEDDIGKLNQADEKKLENDIENTIDKLNPDDRRFDSRIAIEQRKNNKSLISTIGNIIQIIEDEGSIWLEDRIYDTGLTNNRDLIKGTVAGLFGFVKSKIIGFFKQLLSKLKINIQVNNLEEFFLHIDDFIMNFLHDTINDHVPALRPYLSLIMSLIDLLYSLLKRGLKRLFEWLRAWLESRIPEYTS